MPNGYKFVKYWSNLKEKIIKHLNKIVKSNLLVAAGQTVMTTAVTFQLSFETFTFQVRTFFL